MAYSGFATKTIYGRQLGLQEMSTSVTGSGTVGLNNTFLVGAADIRKETSTADTTAINLRAHGQSYLQGTSAGSSSVYTLDPPIPGVHKVLAVAPNITPVYVKVMNPAVEGILTTAGSTFTVIKCSSGGGSIELIALTTALWASADLTTAAGNGFSMSTTT